MTQIYTPTRSLTPTDPLPQASKSPIPHASKSPTLPEPPTGAQSSRSPTPQGPSSTQPLKYQLTLSGSDSQQPSKPTLPGPPSLQPTLNRSEDNDRTNSDLMVTNHFRAMKPPGPPSPESEVTTLPPDLIKLEPEDYTEERAEESSSSVMIPSSNNETGNEK